MNMTSIRRLAALIILATASAMPALAADTTPAASPAADRLAPARALIADGKWRDAIEALKQVNDSGSADWNNLMGYSHRKAKTPDLAAAERYYDTALRIDAKHKGALEYSGELYLMLGNLPKAQARLAALEGVCGKGCEEHKDLAAEIGRYQANGNRYLPK